jgi:hypothetical protein
MVSVLNLELPCLTYGVHSTSLYSSDSKLKEGTVPFDFEGLRWGFVVREVWLAKAECQVSGG